MKLKHLVEGIHDKWLFKAIFLAGGPGSGKTFFKNRLLPNFKNVDPDRLAELLMRRWDVPFDVKRNAKQEAMRAKADELAHIKTLGTMQKNFITGRLPIVVDRTGADYEGLKLHKNKLENLGYETKMIFIRTPVEQAIKRNLSRERKLDTDFVKSYHKRVIENEKKFKALFGNDFYTIDNKEGSKIEWNILWKKIARWMEKKVNNSAANNWREQQRGKK